MKVSVLIMTYNHERFIEQAVRSALMQQTSFPYEIIISEDCSTDETREIVRRFGETYHDRIRLILSERNVRSNEIVVRGITAARGEYVALLDGDDYWTSPHKLQKQADFLDMHRECSVCFHNAEVQCEGGEQPPWNWTPTDHKEISTIEDLWMGNFIATSSTMFRGGLIPEFPQWYYPLFPITDWPLHLMNAEHGHIGYINQVMAVYRYHTGGLYSSLCEAQKQETTFKLYSKMNVGFNYRYNRLVKEGIFNYFLEWAEEYEQRGDAERARSCLSRCLTGRPSNLLQSWMRMARVWLRLATRSR